MQATKPNGRIGTPSRAVGGIPGETNAAVAPRARHQSYILSRGHRRAPRSHIETHIDTHYLPDRDAGRERHGEKQNTPRSAQAGEAAAVAKVGLHERRRDNTHRHTVHTNLHTRKQTVDTHTRTCRRVGTHTRKHKHLGVSTASSGSVAAARVKRETRETKPFLLCTPCAYSTVRVHLRLRRQASSAEPRPDFSPPETRTCAT